MKIFSIGFTQTSAEDFFARLRTAGIQRLVDVRLNNRSQLAGFAKRDDLAFFLRELCQAQYHHEPLLAPTQEMLDKLKKRRGSWAEYERLFLQLLAERAIEKQLRPEDFRSPTALLCSEPGAEHCHRRLVIEYLQQKWLDVTPVHL